MEKTKITKPKSIPQKVAKEEKKKPNTNSKNDNQFNQVLEKMWSKNYKYIELQALISKAREERTIEELIDNKVNFEFNSMLYQIKSLNSKYNEKRKSYVDIKDEMITLLKRYEKKLYKLCDSYVEELDSLFIERTTLQYQKLNKIIENTMLINQDNGNNSIRKRISKRIADSMTNLMAKIKNKSINKEAYIDVSLYNKMADEIGIKKEIDEKIVLKVNSKNEKYLIEVDNITIKIRDVDKKIKKLYSKIEKSILNSMESKEKALSTDVKPKLREKVTLYFLSRFNMPYLVRKKVFQPFQERLNNIEG